MANRRTDERGDAVPGAPRRNAGSVPEPALTVRAASGQTKGVVLLLHGGRSRSYNRVRAGNLSPARMVPVARHLQRAGGRHGLAVWSLRNSVRGWNGEDMSPLQDARWALGRIRQEHPGVPVYLVGHSMGGLTAVCAADDPQVDGVVALAPWLSGETPAARVAGRKVLIVHGTEDRLTSPAESLKFARRAAPETESLQYVSLKGAGHFMFRRLAVWNALTTGFVLRAFSEKTGFPVPDDPVLGRLIPSSASSIPVVL
ncbi:alpha/beta hydrolase [Pseudarthrobacter sp. N5]|uniref:alpha/beta hydrolase n=1 Tax=Pseudarthrobacter sp. N5 TaxID=3418416 RepID=UPI003CF69998